MELQEPKIEVVDGIGVLAPGHYLFEAPLHLYLPYGLDTLNITGTVIHLSDRFIDSRHPFIDGKKIKEMLGGKSLTIIGTLSLGLTRLELKKHIWFSDMITDAVKIPSYGPAQ